MAQNDEIILININGADRPGVTAALTEILAKNNAVILDIGQADIHNHLSLGILFQSTEGNSGDILKELLSGIRNEEDYLITENGARLLGKKIPLRTEEVEAIR